MAVEDLYELKAEKMKQTIKSSLDEEEETELIITVEVENICSVWGTLHMYIKKRNLNQIVSKLVMTMFRLTLEKELDRFQVKIEIRKYHILLSYFYTNCNFLYYLCYHLLVLAFAIIPELNNFFYLTVILN